MFQTIGHEILSIRNPSQLAELAGERKKTMMLLPYGIPIAVGSIAYFGWTGLSSDPDTPRAISQHPGLLTTSAGCNLAPAGGK